MADTEMMAPPHMPEMPAEMPQDMMQKPGFVESVKSNLNPEALAEKFNLSKERLLLFGLYLGAGFLSGFLFRKYAKFLFFLSLGIIGLVVLQHMGVVTVLVDWTKVEHMFGLQQPMMVDSSLVSMAMDWIKVNVAPFSSFVIGFLIGLKLG